VIARYVEMAELAAMENDLPLVVRLMRTVFDKLEEELGLVQPAERPDNRPSLGGRDKELVETLVCRSAISDGTPRPRMN